jgi:hypothetical protein
VQRKILQLCELQAATKDTGRRRPAPSDRETSIRFRRFRHMPGHRRPLRMTVATTVLFAVIATFVVIIARGPTKFFQSRNVQSGVSCTVRHCPPTDDEPDGNIWRYTRN